MLLFNEFWAPRKMYAPCGMFTIGHMRLLIRSLIILSILLIVSRKVTSTKIRKITKGCAILITILEGVKIYFNFFHGYIDINVWFPISYCSIFIYALWLSGYANGKWQAMGDIFIAGVSIVAGGTYLVFPSTSLMMYSMNNYLCQYSMIFHTLMVYVGVLYFSKMNIKLNRRNFINYAKLYLTFGSIAIILNIYFGSNLMLLSNPANIPLKILYRLYELSPWSYTFLVFIVYLFVPYVMTSYIGKFIKRLKKRS